MADSSSKTKDATQSDLSIDLLAILNRRKGLIFASAVFGLAAGAAYFFLMPPKYESSAQVLLMQNDSASMASDVAAGEMSVSEELLATHMSLIQSRRLVQKALSHSVEELLSASPEVGQDDFDISSEGIPASKLNENAAVVSSEDVPGEGETDVVQVTLPLAGGSDDSAAGEGGLADSDSIDEVDVGYEIELLTLAELPSIQSQLGEDGSALNYVIDNLYVTRGGEGAAKNARILSIAFRHTDENDARYVVTALLQEYQTFVESKFQDINDEAIELIGKARLEIQQGIDDANQAYADFRKDDGTPILASVEGGANIHAIRYEELASEISQLDSEIDEAKARIRLVANGIDRLSGSDGPELEKLALIDQQNAERLGILVTVERGEAQTAAFQATQPERIAGAQTEYSSLLALKAQLAQAKQDFGPKHPEVQTLENQVSEMETFFVSRQAKLGNIEDEAPLTPDDVMTAYQRLLENDLVALEQKRVDLIKQMARTEDLAKNLIQSELEDDRLSREITRQEELYSSVIERLRDLNMQEDSSALIQEVIAEPEVGEKVSPNAPIAAAIAMLSTMLLAGASVLLAELSDKSIHSAEDLEAIYDAPILSHIPDFEKDAETRLLMKKIRKSDSKLAPELIVHHDPKSRISELYRTVRTQILFNSTEGKNVIAVTSPTQSDGKSTTIANLAVSLANTGKSVLLIDADMRRPAIHKIFGMQQNTGLSEVLKEEAEPADAMQFDPGSRLSVMTCGAVPENPAELLVQDRFSGFLAQVREKFDFVLIDCPPVLPVSDPCIIGSHADSLLLVTSIDANELPKSRQSMRILSNSNLEMRGIIVNRTGSYSSYDYYSREEGYVESNTRSLHVKKNGNA